jgi:hypothetical protein
VMDAPKRQRELDRAGNVTLRPPLPRRSQMLKPISFKPIKRRSPLIGRFYESR